MAVAGDEPAFAALTERHRRDSTSTATDAGLVTTRPRTSAGTFLEAWRSRSGLSTAVRGSAGQLYRIATDVCLDMLRRSSRRTAGNSHPEVPWLQPYPDLLLEAAAPSDEQPEAVAIQRETISLAFLAALQVLPPRHRAS